MTAPDARVRSGMDGPRMIRFHGGPSYYAETGVRPQPVPPWLPWTVLLIALVTSGLALRALACAS